MGQSVLADPKHKCYGMSLYNYGLFHICKSVIFTAILMIVSNPPRTKHYRWEFITSSPTVFSGREVCTDMCKSVFEQENQYHSESNLNGKNTEVFKHLEEF